jgi:hypothetical protein
MSRYTRILLLSLAALLLSTAASAADLSPSTVLLNANQHNGQSIIVSGIVSHLAAKLAQDGTPYQTFKLCDANACLQVYALGTTAYTEGEQLSAKGHFWMFVQRGYQTFHNELDIDP